MPQVSGQVPTAVAPLGAGGGGAIRHHLREHVRNQVRNAVRRATSTVGAG